MQAFRQRLVASLSNPEGVDMVSGGVVLQPPETDPRRVEFILEAHSLIREYARERAQHPMRESALSHLYLDEYVNVAQRWLPDLANNAGLADSLIVARCMQAFALPPRTRATNPQLALRALDWIRLADPGWPAEDAEAALAGKQAAQRPLYWKYVYDCVLTGRMETAAQVLDSTLLQDPQSLPRAVQALMVQIVAHLSVPFPESEREFREWRREAIELKLEAQNLESGEWRQPLALLSAILHGHRETVVSLSANWYTCVAALFVYGDPSLEMLDEYYAASTPKQHQSEWEEACALVFQDNVVEAVSVLCDLDSLTAAVVTELSYNLCAFSEYPRGGRALKELTAILHALRCLSSDELVPEGLEMLENVGSGTARCVLEAALPALAARSQGALDAALDAAVRFDFGDTVSLLYRQAATRSRRQHDFVQAIVYLCHSGDSQQTHALLWDTFEEYLVSGPPQGPPSSVAVLRRPDPGAEHFSPAVCAVLAPLAVLVGLLDELETFERSAPDQSQIARIKDAATALLSLPGVPLEFYPPVVAMVALRGVSSVLERKHIVDLICALDIWTRSSKRQRGLSLLEKLRSGPLRNEVDSSSTGEQMVILLRETLARDASII